MSDTSHNNSLNAQSANENEWHGLGVRRFGRLNVIGVWTLYIKEVQRFWKVMTQTVVAPVITTLLFLTVFALALGKFRPDVNGVPFISFLAPGLIIMTMLQNAFSNPSSSLLAGKVMGNIVDILMPPLSPMEMNLALALGGLTRGLVVGFGTYLGMIYFVDFLYEQVWAVFFFAVTGSLFMAQIGTIAGIWSEKFDHMQAIMNFIITPLAFLSGTFYSIKQLPETFQLISQFNPFFYIIDGFRYGFTGHAEGDIAVGMGLMVFLNVMFWMINLHVLRKGYRIKS
ncbi:MAG: ABC transporter permease [Parvibaculales bacterium]